MLLVVVVHHIIMDNWSWMIVRQELTALLAGEPLEPAEGVRFIDYVAWLVETTDERRVAAELAYWTTKLGGELPILNLPKDRPRPAVASRIGHAVAVVVPPDVGARAKRLAEQEGTTLFVIMLAAYQAFLLRLTGQADLIVGTALAGRDQVVAEKLVGCFVKSVALRTDLAGAICYRDAVKRVHATVIEAQDHQLVPYEEIVAKLNGPRNLSVHPVFQTMFVLQSTESVEIDLSSILGYGSAKWDLTLALNEALGGLGGVLECSADLFDATTLARFADMYLQFLASVTAEPDRLVGGHSLISAAERDRILYALNPYERPSHGYRTLAQPFEAQVERTPEAIALVDDEGELTYADLNERANRLAHFLRAAGAESGTRIGLCLNRSFAMVIALYAVAKSGATYVPLDPEFPDARLAFMLTDTTPLMVLTDSKSRGRIPDGPWPVVSLDGAARPWEMMSASNVEVSFSPNQPSHLLYTSGSTGRPKAVTAAVDGSIADILWMQSRYPFGPGDAALFKTSYGFDVSIWEIFWPLYAGARLVVCRPGGHRDVHHLAKLIDQHQVTTVFIIPTQLQVFLDELPEGSCSSLHWVLSGGEPVTPRLRDTCHARLSAELVQGYGATEVNTATDMIVPRAPGSPVVPLGRPSSNFRLYVLDENLNVAPIGVPGEAYIAAEIGLAHGYFRRPELTAERFLPDPFGPSGARMYRTGDICRYREDGVLEHQGRIGSQVKIRGMRIELTEVQAVLCEDESVEECVVLAVRHDGEQAIAAFIVPKDRGGAEVALRSLRAHAARMLPAYMVPTSMQIISGIPVNVNGKTDRDALLRQWSGKAAEQRSEYVPPEDDVEATLAAIFARTLGLAEVSMTDGFFERGGHSLLVFKLIAACAEELRVRLNAADVFAAPTVRELARRVRSSEISRKTCLVPLAPNPGRLSVVFVHAASGSVFPFREIATRLADKFAVYALQDPDSAGPVPSIEDMATRYLLDVDEVRGLSPVCVVGWSMGGCVALEMTREWKRRGVDVAATLLLDTWPPPAILATASARAQARKVIEELDIFAAEGVDMDSLGEATAELDRLLRVTNRNRQAFLDYRPERFDGQVHLLRVSDGPTVSASFPSGEGNDWNASIADLVSHEISGTHFSLLHAQHADALAGTICGIVDMSLAFDVV